MPKYLIDVNLPYYFQLWNNPAFIHQKDINDTATDQDIWEYARQQELIIISKDKDFSLKLMAYGPPPKLIHRKFGNVKMKDFFHILTKCWPDVERLIQTHSLVNIYQNQIEAIR